MINSPRRRLLLGPEDSAAHASGHAASVAGGQRRRHERVADGPLERRVQVAARGLRGEARAAAAAAGAPLCEQSVLEHLQRDTKRDEDLAQDNYDLEAWCTK